MATIERVGIVGAGRTSSAHLRALSRLPKVAIVGILDTNQERAQTLAAQFGVPRHFGNSDRFYREAAPDIVHILTPPHTHEQLAIEALERGAHMLVEKPPSLTVSGCNGLQARAEAANLTVGVNENLAFDPLILSARAAIARGTLGKLVHIDAFYGFDASLLTADLASWSWAKELPGGILEDLLPHPLTVARALAGQDLEATCWHVLKSGRLAFDLPDELRLLLTGAEGLTVNLTVSLSARAIESVVTIYGTRATLRIDLRNMLFVLSRTRPGDRPVARTLHMTGSLLETFIQIARNSIATTVFRAPRMGNPLHLIRCHYQALRLGHELPAPISRAKRTVQIARQIWPHPDDLPSRANPKAKFANVADIHEQQIG